MSDRTRGCLLCGSRPPDPRLDTELDTGHSHLNQPHPADTTRWIDVALWLIKRRRRWSNIKPTSIQRLVSAGHLLLSWISDPPLLHLHENFPITIPDQLFKIVKLKFVYVVKQLKEENNHFFYDIYILLLLSRFRFFSLMETSRLMRTYLLPEKTFIHIWMGTGSKGLP